MIVLILTLLYGGNILFASCLNEYRKCNAYRVPSRKLNLHSNRNVYINSNDNNDMILSEVKGLPIAISSSLLTLNDGYHHLYVNSTSLYNINVNSNDISITMSEVDRSNIIDNTDLLLTLLIAMIKYSSLKLEKNVLITSSFIDNNRNENNNEEYVDWLSNDEQVLASLPRSMIHKLNLLHKGIGVLIVNSNHDIFVHQRASTKRIFPSMYDMFIGGVSSMNESPDVTLLRELYEEAGLDFSTTLPCTNTDNNIKVNRKTSVTTPWISSEADRAWQSFKQSTTYSKLFNSLSDNNDNTITKHHSNSWLKYIKKCRIKTNLNYCVVYVYIAFCSKAMEGINIIMH